MATYIPRRHLIAAVIALALQVPMMQALESVPQPERPVGAVHEVDSLAP
ncbi:hypothetical protein ACH4SP_22975 [Streptomyces sp. NPDC021093]